jgi:cytochrome c oxidase subunit II
LKTWPEAVLALGVTLILGASLWLWTGEPVGGEPTTGSTTPIAVDTEAAARGQTLAQETGCLNCHTTDGSAGTGPTWKGLAGASRPLASGESVTADNAYLFNSIVDPTSQVVEGFDAVMPTTYNDQLSQQDIDDLVAYINSLG